MVEYPFNTSPNLRGRDNRRNEGVVLWSQLRERRLVERGEREGIRGGTWRFRRIGWPGSRPVGGLPPLWQSRVGLSAVGSGPLRVLACRAHRKLSPANIPEIMAGLRLTAGYKCGDRGPGDREEVEAIRGWCRCRHPEL